MRRPANTCLGTPALYAHYKSKYPGSKITFTVYLKVLSLYFKGIVKLLLTGWTWKMEHYLSEIRIQKVERRYTKPRVDMGATKKLLLSRPDIPRDTKVYFTNQPFWYRYYWHKNHCLIPNKTAYRFDASCGPAGNTRKITRLLETDSLAHLNFTH